MQTEFIVGVGVLVILYLNWESFMYYLLGTFQFFLEKIGFEFYFWGLIGILGGIVGLLSVYWINSAKIKSLSYVDFMPTDEYEKKKKDWTNQAMLELVQHPKYQEWKTKIDDQREDLRRRGILSEEQSIDNNDELSD